MNFDRSEKLKPIHDALWELGKQFRKGQKISFREIEAATGLTRYGEHWRYVLRKFMRKKLKEDGITIWCYGDSCLTYLTDSETVRHVPKARHRRAFRQTTFLKRSLEKVDLAKLSTLEARLHYAAANENELIRKQCHRSRYAVRVGYGPTPTTHRNYGAGRDKPREGQAGNVTQTSQGCESSSKEAEVASAV